MFPNETSRVKGNDQAASSPWLLWAEDARLEHLQLQTPGAAPSLVPSCHKRFQQRHFPRAAVLLNFTLSLLKPTRTQTKQTKATYIRSQSCDWHVWQITGPRNSAIGQEPWHYCSHSIKGTSRWFRRVKKKMRQLLTAFHIWRKEPSAWGKQLLKRHVWNSVRFNFTEEAQQIRRENRTIDVTKQQRSFIQLKLGWTTKLLILFSTQLHVVNWEYHSEFTRGYKHLFQSSFLTILIPVFLKLTVQGTY